MKCGPTGRLEVAKLAIPEAFRGPVPKTVDPSLKVTVPEGVPVPGAATATIAVKLTDWLKTDGLTEDVRAVVVFSGAVCPLTIVVVVAESFAEFASRVALEIKTVLLMEVPGDAFESTRATRVIVAAAPADSDANVTVAVLPELPQVPPPVELHETRPTLVGRISVNATDAASFGPAL